MGWTSASMACWRRRGRPARLPGTCSGACWRVRERLVVVAQGVGGERLEGVGEFGARVFEQAVLLGVRVAFGVHERFEFGDLGLERRRFRTGSCAGRPSASGRRRARVSAAARRSASSRRAAARPDSSSARRRTAASSRPCRSHSQPNSAANPAKPAPRPRPRKNSGVMSGEASMRGKAERQKAEGGRRKAEGGRRKAEGRRETSDGHAPTSMVFSFCLLPSCLLPSAFCLFYGCQPSMQPNCMFSSTLTRCSSRDSTWPARNPCARR